MTNVIRGPWQDGPGTGPRSTKVELPSHDRLLAEQIARPKLDELTNEVLRGASVEERYDSYLKFMEIMEVLDRASVDIPVGMSHEEFVAWDAKQQG